MAAEPDPFRNPAGHTLRHNLGVLFDAVILSDDRGAAAAAVAEIVRLRAVQDFDADEAVAFLPIVKSIVDDDGAPDADLDARIDRLTEVARGVYRECRGRIDTIRVNELRRRAWNVGTIRRSERV